MEKKERCIVLKTVKYGDNKLIIDFLTREEGRVSAVWKVPTSPRARVRRQFFQPLSLLEIDFECTPRQQFAQIKDVRILHPYCTLQCDGVKMSVAFFLSEFLCYATRDMHGDALLYDFVEQGLLWFDMTERGVANFHLMFMMRLSRFLGFHPDVQSYREGSLFNLREGCFSMTAPLHRDFVSVEDASRLVVLLRMNINNVHLFRMSRADRSRAVDLVLHYYRLHVPQFGELRSLDVLRAL